MQFSIYQTHLNNSSIDFDMKTALLLHSGDSVPSLKVLVNQSSFREVFEGVPGEMSSEKFDCFLENILSEVLLLKNC